MKRGIEVMSAKENKKKYNMTIALNSDDTLIVMDTNVWLDLYLIHPLALQEIVDSLDYNSHLIWIPHQVWLEFSRNSAEKKRNVIELYKTACSDSLKELNTAKDRIIAKLDYFQRNNRTDGEPLKQELVSCLTECAKKIRDGYDILKENYENEISVISKENDIVYDLVKKIYDQNQSKDFTFIEKMQICEEGEVRSKYKVAPGYTDTDKSSDTGKSEFWRKYGDLIIWKEILRKVENTNKNVIFVENEKKEDWFETKRGDKLAAILYEEYATATNHNGRIEVCDLLSFIESYGDSLNLLAPAISELVEKLKHEKAVVQYVNENAEEILIKNITAYFEDEDNISNIFSEFAGCNFGGTFEDIEDIEIVDIGLESDVVCEYDRDWSIFSITGRFGVSGSGMLTEYVSRDVNHYGYIDYEIVGNIWLYLDIDF